ncbi:uncharacterized protein B0I36DRAFT_426578 [Microdochium trichocladiopsis]|uniref:Uncharacterized protein n=1 Tax=Microdochium trichocladiopsis TaxID=1682393 RepID=A0A9P8YJ79_9PEZI|nr:uncharacterized protein B0I36DRAFT_426578 [Microdochium trichocladiopsis]KAH7040030.1 hypothetical protein B0I36DRAFT_426578 [Microdochium trichocladiopsis]
MQPAPPQPQPKADPGSRKALEAAMLHKVPPKWAYLAGEGEPETAAYYEHRRSIDPLYEHAGVLNKTVLVNQHDRFLMRQVPSPAPVNQAKASTVSVAVQRPGAGGMPSYKIVDATALEAEARDGWEPCVYPDSAYDEQNDDKDMRHVERIQDVSCIDEPWKDQQWRFQKEIAFWNKIEGVNWQPGDVHDETTVKEQSLSFAPSFRPRSGLSTFASATSNGHFHLHRRPARVGLGWGGYDRFDDWQSYGRQIKPEMVPQYPKNAPAELCFVGEDGTRQVFEPLENDVSAERELPDTLYEKLHAKKAAATRGGAVGRGGGRRTPNRGGQRGRGFSRDGWGAGHHLIAYTLGDEELYNAMLKTLILGLSRDSDGDLVIKAGVRLMETALPAALLDKKLHQISVLRGDKTLTCGADIICETRMVLLDTLLTSISKDINPDSTFELCRFHKDEDQCEAMQSRSSSGQRHPPTCTLLAREPKLGRGLRRKLTLGRNHYSFHHSRWSQPALHASRFHLCQRSSPEIASFPPKPWKLQPYSAQHSQKYYRQPQMTRERWGRIATRDSRDSGLALYKQIGLQRRADRTTALSAQPSAFYRWRMTRQWLLLLSIPLQFINVSQHSRVVCLRLSKRYRYPHCILVFMATCNNNVLRFSSSIHQGSPCVTESVAQKYNGGRSKPTKLRNSRDMVNVLVGGAEIAASSSAMILALPVWGAMLRGSLKLTKK